MLDVQIAYSIVTLISAYTVVFQYHPRVGVLLGAIMQFAWIHYWYTTAQLGIIILDLGILLIYLLRILGYLKE